LAFKRADQKKGITGINLLLSLEQRLDNVVYRLGLANSRPQARQLVRHNHFLVNGRKVNIPSFQVKVGDVVEVRDKSQNVQVINDALEAVVRRTAPAWLELDADTRKGTIRALPTREDITTPIQENLIVELYSK
jgi:small subunit ribosomal protein S4